MENSDERLAASDDDRRDFLKSCGRFALTVPPVMTVLLSTSLSSAAIAKSTGGGGGGGGGGHGKGHGNNGVGNGPDPQPPGNPPINDGPGTGPGAPGNRGGPKRNQVDLSRTRVPALPMQPKKVARPCCRSGADPIRF
jgi:hypothetical protein